MAWFMGRAFGFLSLVVALWIAMEFYANGIEAAFGGALGSDRESARPLDRAEHAADGFQRAYDASIARVDRAMEE